MFILLIGFASGSLISLLFINPHEIDHAEARELPSEQNGVKPLPLIDLFKKKSILFFNFALILYYIANGAQMTLIGQVLAAKVPIYGALFIAICMIVAEITMIFVAFVMSRIVYRFNRKTFFLTAFFMLPIRAILFTLVESPFLLILIQVLDGIAAGILGVIGIVINSDLAVNTGRFNFLQSVGSMSVSMGETLSQLFAGFVAVSFGFNMSFYALALVAFIGILFFTFLMPETKPKNLTD